MNQLKGFIPIVLVVAAILGLYFFAYPQWTKYNEAKTALDSANSKNASLKQAQSELNSFLAEYKNSSAQVQKANKILPNKKADIENLLANMDSFATNSGVALSGLNFTDSGDAAASKVAPYQMSYMDIAVGATGTYASFRAFIGQFEKSLRLMDIMSVSLSVSQGQDNLEYKLRVRAYYQK